MTALLIVLGAFLLGIIIYWIWSTAMSEKVLVTKKSDGTLNEKADQFYYLPTASLQVKATATVTLTKTIPDNRIISAKLAQVQLENTVVMQPDTSQLLIAQYQSSDFANDELRITTNTLGLLESASVTTEDRITNVISALTQAPATIMTGKAALAARTLSEEFSAESHILQTVQYTETFVIRPEELTGNVPDPAKPGKLKDVEFMRKWIINTDGLEGDKNNVDASIQFRLPARAGVDWSRITGDLEGLTTRPLERVSMNIHTKPAGEQDFSSDPTLTYDILIPDVSRVLTVPLKRERFVKNQNTPKFSNGLLIENYILKPSQVEAALSIPINVLKAIVSIPGQLLSFKIAHLTQESSLLAAEKKLADAQKPTPPAPPAQPSPEKPKTPDLSQQLQQAALDRLKDQLAKGRDPSVLGKAPASPDPKHAAKMAVARALAAPASVAFDVPPTTAMWQNKITGDWNSYTNETNPYCVPAAGAHMIMCWTSQTQAAPKRLSLDDVVAAYKAVADEDGKCQIWKFLDFWELTGFGTDHDKAITRIQLTKPTIDQVRYAVNYYGNCLVGMQMPLTAKDRDTWEKPSGPLIGVAQRGSWCGHAVPILGYFPNYFITVSMGRIVTMSWDFFNAYVDEAFVVFSKTYWLKPDNTSPQGTALDGLDSGLDSLNNV